MADQLLLLIGSSAIARTPSRIIQDFQKYLELKEGRLVRIQFIRGLLDSLFQQKLVTRINGFRITLSKEGRKKYGELLEYSSLDMLEAISLTSLSA